MILTAPSIVVGTLDNPDDSVSKRGYPAGGQMTSNAASAVFRCRLAATSTSCLVLQTWMPGESSAFTIR